MRVWSNASAWLRSKTARIKLTRAMAALNMKPSARLVPTAALMISRRSHLRIKFATNTQLIPLPQARRLPLQWNVLRRASSPKNKQAGLNLSLAMPMRCSRRLNMMVKGEGEFGKTLGMGSERAAKVWGKGSDEFLITVKGAESPAHMPQAKRSLALIYAVNPFGADHQSSEHDPYYEEGVGDFNLDRLKQIGLGSPQPAYSLTEEKVRFAYETEVFYSMLDSAELCQFVYGPTWTLYDGKDTVAMMNAVTGWDLTVEELMDSWPPPH